MGENEFFASLIKDNFDIDEGLFLCTRLRSLMELCILIPGNSSKHNPTMGQVSLASFSKCCLFCLQD